MSIGRCMKCKTIFLAEADHFFQEDLYSYYKQYIGAKIEDLVSPLTLVSYDRVLKRLCKITNIQNILDVGCGKGEFVWAARNSGYAIKGIELSLEAVSVARSFNLPVQQHSLFSPALDSSSWNAITMFEVIEHVENPVAMIQRATDLLAPGGVLYLTTPNYDSLDRLCLGEKWNVFHPEHIIYFSTRGLARLVRQHEPRLRLIAVESNNISPQLFGFVRSLFRLPYLGKRNLKSSGYIDDHVVAPDLRTISEGTSLLRSLKRLINLTLTIMGMGSTTILIAHKKD
ncbi:class I SAM-dependent methyltransferase [Synechococcus sp. MIT S9508]|uniref:class I SAM-dependent methyltransferase n=1 Tax=Synechococcus sp. MIT S9508 TaxID=1801629 RepID=UPI0039A5D417